jgi:hypothetical protein
MKLMAFPTSLLLATVFFALSTTGIACAQSVPTGQVSHIRQSATAKPKPAESKSASPVALLALSASAITNNGFTANWPVSAGATEYELEVSKDRTFSSTQDVGDFTPKNVGNVTSFAVTGLTKDTQYYFRVRAKNGSVLSAYSSTIAVKTQATATVVRAEDANEAPAAPGATDNSKMEDYRKSKISGDCAPTPVPDAISDAAINAYEAASSVLIPKAAGGTLSTADQAVNTAVCNVAKAVLTAPSDAGKAATTAQKTELQYAAPDLKATVQKATDAVVQAVTTPTGRCTTTTDYSDPKKPVTTYTNPTLFPLYGPGCTSQNILSFYDKTGTITLASSVRYLYGVTATSNAISSDLVTGTFPLGFQIKLGTNVTTSASTSSSSSTTTDTAATAITKLEQGGDFYVQGLYPVLSWSKPNQGFSLYSQFAPKLGFTVSGLGSQQTITQATDTNFYYPAEFYAQFADISGTNSDPVLVFLDAQVGGESIGSDLAKSLNYNRNFFLGEFSVGLEFNSAIRVSFQRFEGPSEMYKATATGTSTQANASGWHLAVELLPKSLSKSK